MKKDGSIEKIYGREDPIKSDFELLPNPRAYDSEKENYEHFFAKLKLYDWLRATQRDNIEKDRVIDVIHIEKENEAKDKIYLEFPVIYPYEGFISEGFIKNDKYIYPKIYPDTFKKSPYLNVSQKKELVDLLTLFWPDDHEKYYSGNNIAKLMISILKNWGIEKFEIRNVFIDFLGDYFGDNDNRKNIGRIAVENMLINFYENNYNFEIPRNEDLWLEDVQKEILSILNERIIYYLDLGIVHREEIRPKTDLELEVLKHDIEIVNKSPVNIEKIKYLLKHINSDIPIIIIPSNVILQQYMMPNHLYGYIYYKNGWFLRKKTGDVEIDISSKKYRKFINFDDHGQRR
ncbi:MAG: hypothetical protein RXO36_07185 [Candidatus Nanopusillus acidilobi]